MRYAVTFIALGLSLSTIAIRDGGLAWLLIWPGVNTTILGAGYAGLGAGVLGKRSDGRIAAWGKVLHLPYLVLTLGMWHLVLATTRENFADEVAPGLWVGRRPLRKEIPDRIRWVIDMTAEFGAGPYSQVGRGYVCYPMLDAHVCGDVEFARIVDDVARLEGDVLVHCAQGHGRSATVAAGVMIARGLAPDVAQAERLLSAKRPGVRLSRAQRALVARAIPVPAARPRAAQST